MATFSVRPCTPSDIEAMCAIYAHYIRTSTCTWAWPESDLPVASEWQAKLAAATARGLPWLVAEEGGSAAGAGAGTVAASRLIGYCTVGEFRARTGWRNTCEHSIYTLPEAQRRGVGRALLECMMRTEGVVHPAVMAFVSSALYLCAIGV